MSHYIIHLTESNLANYNVINESIYILYLELPSYNCLSYIFIHKYLVKLNHYLDMFHVYVTLKYNNHVNNNKKIRKNFSCY